MRWVNRGEYQTRKNIFENKKINPSQYQPRLELVVTNYIHNYIQSPFLEAQKWRKPLISQGFSLGAGNRT